MSLHLSIPQPVTEADRQLPCAGRGSSNSNEHRLSSVASLKGGPWPGTWGLTIARTDYKAPRQQLLNALACINDAVQNDLGATRPYQQRKNGIRTDGISADHGWPTTSRNKKSSTAGDEVFARYTPVVLSNYSSLHEAHTDTVRSQFQSWIVQRQGNAQGGDMRYVFCIVLDTETIQKLHDIWCRRSRVGAAQKQSQVRVLDALPDDECKDAYKVDLRGKYGLVEFSFTRSIRRQPLAAMLTKPHPGDGNSMWCFGPSELPLEEDSCDEPRAPR
ncbi:hypothetical protein LLEC1_00160 [Akanthomyces lecanii]|uniref:Uncharacterized protein n=1 Tax=Cordyceps confragosa TaxID=2714763 RepID=A0A179IHG3_CORDF|nr:hypothetical protein LLEC1_00160 [Akanthomyces lecanii]